MRQEDRCSEETKKGAPLRPLHREALVRGAWGRAGARGRRSGVAQRGGSRLPCDGALPRHQCTARIGNTVIVLRRVRVYGWYGRAGAGERAPRSEALGGVRGTCIMCAKRPGAAQRGARAGRGRMPRTRRGEALSGVW